MCMYLKAYLPTQCLFDFPMMSCDQPRPQKKNVDLHKSGSSLGAISKRDERTLVQKVKINPRTTAKDLVKLLEETGTKVSISTGKRVRYQHNLKGRSARKCTKTAIIKPDYGLHLHMETKIILFGEMSSGLMKQK